jgi:hypothetical protein
MAPVPPTPPVLVADASEADRIAAKTADDAAVDAYDQQVADFSEALSPLIVMLRLCRGNLVTVAMGRLIGGARRW